MNRASVTTSSRLGREVKRLGKVVQNRIVLGVFWLLGCDSTSDSLHKCSFCSFVLRLTPAPFEEWLKM